MVIFTGENPTNATSGKQSRFLIPFGYDVDQLIEVQLMTVTAIT